MWRMEFSASAQTSCGHFLTDVKNVQPKRRSGLSTGKRVPHHRDYLAADNPTNLASGDLNAMVLPDLVVPNFTEHKNVLLGKADGSFQQVRLFDDGVGRPF